MLTLKQMAQLTGVVVLDTETNGLHYWENKIIGLGFFHPDSGEVGYFPTCDYVSLPYGKVKTKRERTWTGEYAINPATGRRVKVYEERMHVSQAERVEAVPNDAMIAEAKAAVALLAANPKVTIVGHNLKFDAHFLDLDLWGCAASIGDTSIAVHLWDSRLPKALAKAEEIFVTVEELRENCIRPGIDLPLQIHQVGRFVRSFLMLLGVASHGNAELRELAANQRDQFVRMAKSTGDRHKRRFTFGRIAP